MPRILNKNTNKVINISFSPTIEQLIAYYGDNWLNWAQIPDNDKDYIWDIEAEQAIEKTKTLEEAKLAMLDAINTLKKTPFAIAITDINNVESSYYVDLQDSTILKLLVLVKKAEITQQASDEFINATTGMAEYKTFSLAAIQGVQAEVIAKDDFLKLKANQVKNAQNTDELNTIQEELDNA